MNQLEITVGQGEYWYGVSAADGVDFPLNQSSKFYRDYRINCTENQINPILISNRGRFIWCDNGFELEISAGKMKLLSEKAPFIQNNKKTTLREGFTAASSEYFKASEKIPPKEFFMAPQYNTWIELQYNQNQEDILNYAKAILAHGYPAGILMIDDSWNEYYGGWDFHAARFPNPKFMTDQLHKLGFLVMLWTCPFISPDSREYRLLKDMQCLVRDGDGKVAVREWWNGHSAVLDLTNPQAAAWYTKQNQWLMDKYGIDGFKFDAGDGKFYRDNDLTFQPADANRQNELWALYGADYPYNEFRACVKAAGLPLIQRLADKKHSWDRSGLGALIPNALAQGIIGYAYTCPDMIGGGEISSFTDTGFQMDEELFVRYAQCAALMPMMQFSAAPWRVLSPENQEICRQMALLHQQFSSLIWELAAVASKTGEPMIRYMEYQFPDQGFAEINNQFMLGDQVLVAPVCEKGVDSRAVLLPEGHWRSQDEVVYDGGRWVTVSAPLSVLPYFIRA